MKNIFLINQLSKTADFISNIKEDYETNGDISELKNGLKSVRNFIKSVEEEIKFECDDVVKKACLAHKEKCDSCFKKSNFKPMPDRYLVIEHKETKERFRLSPKDMPVPDDFWKITSTIPIPEKLKRFCDLPIYQKN